MEASGISTIKAHLTLTEVPCLSIEYNRIKLIQKDLKWQYGLSVCLKNKSVNEIAVERFKAGRKEEVRGSCDVRTSDWVLNGEQLGQPGRYPDGQQRAVYSAICQWIAIQITLKAIVFLLTREGPTSPKWVLRTGSQTQNGKHYNKFSCFLFMAHPLQKLVGWFINCSLNLYSNLPLRFDRCSIQLKSL